MADKYEKLKEEPHISVVLTQQQLDILKKEGVSVRVGPMGGVIAQKGGLNGQQASGRSPLLAAWQLGVL